MEKVFDNSIAEFHNLVMENNLSWIYILIFIGLALASILTWFLTTQKSRKEILKLKNENAKIIEETEKLKSETRKINSETNMMSIEEKIKLTSLRKSALEQKQKYDDSIRGFSDKYIEFAKTYKNEKSNEIVYNFSRYVYSDIILSFMDFFNLWRPVLLIDEQDKDVFMKIYLLPFFRLCNGFLNKVKQTNFGNSEFLLPKEIFLPIIEFGSNNCRDNDILVLKSEIQKLSDFYKTEFKFNGEIISAHNIA
ncbi:MAG: hypothetical protein H6557_08155 [Lewinellaceae bacterium]|nr:hypothetical protein [Bacteroidota bacterium]MCB9036575.1 hypothetical protein [Lewinellaceae bacterium]